MLREAGAEDTDMLIAVTSNDETNLAVSLLAARLFNIPTRIARVRNQELLGYPRILGEEGFGATAVIWPEAAVTDYLAKLIAFPEALQVLEFGEGLVNLISVRAQARSPWWAARSATCRRTSPNAEARIVGVFRRNRRLEVNKGDDHRGGRRGDLPLRRAPQPRRDGGDPPPRSPVQNIILAGNAAMAQGIVKQLGSEDLRKKGLSLNVRIVESSRLEAKRLAEKLGTDAIVIEGDWADRRDPLRRRDRDVRPLHRALGGRRRQRARSLLAKRLGAKRTIALVNRKIYGDMMQGPRSTSRSRPRRPPSGTHQARAPRRVTAAYSLRHGLAEALEIVAHGNRQSSRWWAGASANHAPRRMRDRAVVRGEGEDAIVHGPLGSGDRTRRPRDRLRPDEAPHPQDRTPLRGERRVLLTGAPRCPTRSAICSSPCFTRSGPS